MRPTCDVKTHPWMIARGPFPYSLSASSLAGQQPALQHLNEAAGGDHDDVEGAVEQIPLEARVIQVADAFDAMVRTERHRAARTLEEVLQELREGSGGQFDPDVVEAFLALAERGEISCQI